MDPVSPRWRTPPMSACDPMTVARYEAAVAALVADAPHAASLLEEALDRAPELALAQVAHAVGEASRGGDFVSPEVAPPPTRGERQHLEVVQASFAGDAERARDLRREHLAEFPGDLLVVWLPVVLDRRR